MRFLRRSLVGIFLLSVTLVLLAWAGNTVRGALADRMAQEPPSFPQRERVIAVNVVTVTPETIMPDLTVYGELRSQRAVDLRSPVGGTVLMADPALTDGGVVRAGQVLLQIDPSEAQAALDRAQTDVQDAQAELRDGERGLALARDELVASESQVTLRETALSRARDLATRGVGTAAAVETAELAASAAQAQVLSRRQAEAQAEARVDQAKTRLARADISLAESQRNFDNTTIIAGFDGTLADVTITEGGRITPNERFAVLVEPTQLEVAFRVSTSQYARLLDETGALANAQVRVGLDVSGVNLSAAGQITRESAVVGAGQTGRLLFATLGAAPGFRPGDFVTVSIAEPPLENVARLPATAVGADGMVLTLDSEDRLVAVAAPVLRRQGDDVIIAAAGLAGQTLVAERSPLLGAGIKVNPVQPVANDAPLPAPEMIVLDPERRAKLVDFVTNSQMPDEAKARVLAQLEAEEVSAETIKRIEDRMGG